MSAPTIDRRLFLQLTGWVGTVAAAAQRGKPAKTTRKTLSDRGQGRDALAPTGPAGEGDVYTDSYQ